MSGLTAIIVEKESIVRLDLEIRLKTIGFDVSAYQSIDEAVAATQTKTPKVLLMSLDPENQNYDIAAARKIRSEFGTYVIYMVAFISSEIMSEIDNSRHDSNFSYIMKPFHEEDLTEALKQAAWSLRTNP